MAGSPTSVAGFDKLTNDSRMPPKRSHSYASESDVDTAVESRNALHHRNRMRTKTAEAPVSKKRAFPAPSKRIKKPDKSLCGILKRFGKARLKPKKPLSFSEMLSELSLAYSLTLSYSIHSLKQKWVRRRLLSRLVTGLSLGTFLVVLTGYLHLSSICRPPRDYVFPDKPFVEYYVHGRGMGHTSRSVAIVDKLNEDGIDVRLFIPHLSFWNGHRAQRLSSTTAAADFGTTSALQITSVTPDDGIFGSLPHILSRLYSDCRVAQQEGKYPSLVISDGDMPGMLRAKLGGIPNAAIAHGQLFHVADKPEFVTQDRHLNKAWKRQNVKNYAASFFSKWTIATHFCYLESSSSSGAVVQTPLRQEVIAMSRARQLAPTSFPTLSRKEEVEKLLIESYALKDRRRLVICYFRDGNGHLVIEALMAAGFDVLLMIDEGDQASVATVHQPQPDGPRLIQVADRHLFLPLMHVADGVASSAGSQLMSECIHSQIPLLALYKEGDDEQYLNVELSRQCQETQVFGTSFESLEYLHHDDLLRNGPQAEKDDNLTLFEEVPSFVKAVDNSVMSEMYYNYLEGPDEVDPVDLLQDDRTPNLPGAVDIIRGILHDVQHTTRT